MVRNNFIVLFYIPLRVIQLPSDVPKAKEKPSRTHKGTQALSSGHLSVSEGDSQKKRKKFSKELEREEKSRSNRPRNPSLPLRFQDYKNCTNLLR